MKKWLSFIGLALLLAPNILFAQQSLSRGRSSQSTQYFQIETDLSLSDTGIIAEQLERALALYQGYFNGMLPPQLLKVRIFSSHNAYLEALAAFPPEYNLRNRQDFLFLYNEQSPEQSLLLLYPRADEVIMRASLVKNLFLHYIFSIAPHMSPWLREGLALYFELATPSDDGLSLQVTENHLYLDRLQLVRESAALTLEELLALDNEAFEANLESSLAHAWAVVNYLMNENRDVMERIIAREVTSEPNSSESITHLELLAISEAVNAYFERSGFNKLMRMGRAAIAQQQYEEALLLFAEAIQVNPTVWSAAYYKGLAAFHLEEYQQAIELYQLAMDLGAQEALIQYALGMVAMQQGDFALAENYFALAETSDRQRFGRHVAEQRQKMEMRQLLK